MNDNEAATLNRMIGRLEEAVTNLKTQTQVIVETMADNLREQRSECLRHWGVTNTLSQNMAKASISHDAIIEEERRAGEKVTSEAAAASAVVARAATIDAAQRAARETGLAEATAAATKAAKEIIEASAREAKDMLDKAAVNRRQQRHWYVEKLIQIAPLLWTIAGAVVTYAILKGV